MANTIQRKTYSRKRTGELFRAFTVHLPVDLDEKLQEEAGIVGMTKGSSSRRSWKISSPPATGPPAARP